MNQFVITPIRLKNVYFGIYDKMLYIFEFLILFLKQNTFSISISASVIGKTITIVILLEQVLDVKILNGYLN